MDSQLISNLVSQHQRDEKEVYKSDHKRSDRHDSRRGDRHSRRDDRHSRRDDRSHHREERREHRRDDRYEEREKRHSRTEVVPIHLRKSRKNAWDKPPAGCEGMTVKQVKQSGLFPHPGEPAKNTYLAATGGLSGHGYNPEVFGTVSAHGAAGIRANRRLYVGNIPENIRERHLQEFLNELMRKKRLATGSGDSITAMEVKQGQGYAIATFRSLEEATAGTILNGEEFQGRPLEIRRPKSNEDIGTSISSNVIDSPNKIFIGGLPVYLGDEQVIELLRAFGELKSFNLIKDSNTGLSKGFAFCEYMDPEVSEIACEGLNGMDLGDKKLVMHKSGKGPTGEEPSPNSDLPLLPVDILAFIAQKGKAEPTNILMLLNMLSEEDLMSDEDYQDIYMDMEEECSKHGKIVAIIIPRPKEDENVQDVGKIFVEFQTPQDAANAQKALAGRQYNDRGIITAFYDVEKFKAIKSQA